MTDPQWADRYLNPNDGRTARRLSKPEVSDLNDVIDKLDPTKLYTHSRDRQGFGKTVNVKFPVDMLGALAHLKEKLPEYKTMADVIRDCAILGMQVRARHIRDGHLDKQIQTAAALASLEDSAARRETFKAAVEDVKQRMHDAFLSDDNGHLGYLIKKAEAAAEGMYEPFAGQLRDLIARYSK